MTSLLKTSASSPVERLTNHHQGSGSKKCNIAGVFCGIFGCPLTSVKSCGLDTVSVELLFKSLPAFKRACRFKSSHRASSSESKNGLGLPHSFGFLEGTTDGGSARDG